MPVMIRAQWMLNTRTGPSVGEKEVNSLEEGWTALEQGVRESFAEWTEEHQKAMAQVRQAFEREAEQSLSERGRWKYYSTAFVVSLHSDPQ